MFEIQHQEFIKGFAKLQWCKLVIPSHIEEQLSLITDRKDKMRAYNTLARMMSNSEKIPMRVIEVV